jgi:hypothetical protein
MPECPRPEKIPHRTRWAARAAISALYQAGKGNPDLNAYRCDCGAWHVGHSSVRLRKRIQTALNPSRLNRHRRHR